MKVTKFILVFTCFAFVNFKYLVKKKPKVPDPMEFNVPQVPDIAFQAYPAIQWQTLEQKYDEEMISGEDLAQIETNVGKALPKNAKLIAKTVPKLLEIANK